MIALTHAGLAIGLLALAALVGGMTFFGAGATPAAFRVLEGPARGNFLHALFPAYYRFSAIAAAVAAIALCRIALWPAVVLALVFLLMLWLWLVLLPRVSRLRDSPDQRAFARAHRLALVLNQLALLAGVAILVRLALLM